MLKDKLPDLYQIFTFPRQLVQFNSSAVVPATPVTPISPFAPFQMSSTTTTEQPASDQNENDADPENAISSPSSVKPVTDRIFQHRRLTFDQKKAPLPTYLKVLKQVSAVLILVLIAIILIGSIHDYTRYEVTTTLDIRRIPPPYHITLCFDVPEIVITSKLPIELQTKISALKSKSRSEFIHSVNEELEKELNVEKLNEVTPTLIQMLSTVKLGNQIIPVDDQHIISFFKGFSKCFTIKFENLNWFKFFESNLVIGFHDKKINSVKVFIHYDNLIHGNKRKYKLISFGSGPNGVGASSKVTLSYRIVRRLFLPNPYVTMCYNYGANGHDSKAHAVDTCIVKKAMEGGRPLPDHVILPINSTLKYTTIKRRGQDDSGSGQGNEPSTEGGSGQELSAEETDLKNFLSNSSLDCRNMFLNADCIEDTVTIYQTERETVTPEIGEYQPEIIVTNPIDDFTIIHYIPLKTLSDEIFAVSGAIGFMVGCFLLVSYLSKIILGICNKHK